MTMNDLEKLIGRMLAGELSNEETKQLETLLENDPVARRQYVEQCQLHAQLMSNAELKPFLRAEELIDAESSIEAEVALAVGGGDSGDECISGFRDVAMVIRPGGSIHGLRSGGVDHAGSGL